MFLQSTTSYRTDSGDANYYVLRARDLDVSLINPNDVCVARAMLKPEQFEMVRDFLEGCPPDKYKHVDSIAKLFPAQRFCIVVPYVNTLLDKFIVAVHTHPRYLNEEWVADFYNFYPARRGLQQTHTMNYKKWQGLDILRDEEFIKDFRHTFKTLADLCGESKFTIDRVL